MSTRANIVIQDANGHLFFYRHADGYPSVAAEELKTFLRWVIAHTIRDNIHQSAGWLVLLGHTEYADSPFHSRNCKPGTAPQDGGMDWKCGAYEPACGISPDIEFLYIVDLPSKEIRCCLPVYVAVPGETYRDASFDPEHPPEPFYTVTADNIDDTIPEDAGHTN